MDGNISRNNDGKKSSGGFPATMPSGSALTPPLHDEQQDELNITSGEPYSCYDDGNRKWFSEDHIMWYEAEIERMQKLQQPVVATPAATTTTRQLNFNVDQDTKKSPEDDIRYYRKKIERLQRQQQQSIVGTRAVAPTLAERYSNVNEERRMLYTEDDVTYYKNEIQRLQQMKQLSVPTASTWATPAQRKWYTEEEVSGYKKEIEKLQRKLHFEKMDTKKLRMDIAVYRSKYEREFRR